MQIIDGNVLEREVLWLESIGVDGRFICENKFRLSSIRNAIVRVSNQSKFRAPICFAIWWRRRRRRWVLSCWKKNEGKINDKTKPSVSIAILCSSCQLTKRFSSFKPLPQVDLLMSEYTVKWPAKRSDLKIAGAYISRMTYLASCSFLTPF